LAEEKGYWQGEWICADCGYIYDPDIFPGQPFFEEQTKGFKCPQCSGPRRRYAKKVVHQCTSSLHLWFYFFLPSTNVGNEHVIYTLSFRYNRLVTPLA
jgi:rubredoxin